MSAAEISVTSEGGSSRWAKLRHVGREAWIMLGGIAAILVALVAFLVLPLYALFKKSVEDDKGNYVGLVNFQEYYESPGLLQSITNSLTIAVLTMVIACFLAFLYAYGLTRTCMPFKKTFRAIATIPILAPSLLPAISLIYLFGNQGLIKGLLLGESIYGPIGIMIAMVFYIFPHVMMIMVTALSTTDARLYEAAEALGTRPSRVFFTVTLPGAIYGIVSAAVVAFTLTITDFGVPKVIGGQYNVLATDIYKQVVGQQNFSMGAVVGIVLLIPALFSFVIDRHVQKKQVALLSARAVPYHPKPHKARDMAFLLFCLAMTVFLVGILGTAAFGSFAKFWPYDLSLSLVHYDFDKVDPNGWSSFFNSLKMASMTAVIGVVVIFLGAYFVEKGQGFARLRGFFHMLAMMPMAVPGLVLGLAYVFFFSVPENPLSFLYSTMAILVICTVIHFYTVSHLTMLTALKQIDKEFESVSASLKVPFYKTMFRVHVPICLPAISEVMMYLFVNAMTTVSAVVFLYSADTKLAAITVLNLDDVGDQAEAAAMAMMIVATSLTVRVLHGLLMRALNARHSAWRTR
ncbi:MAG: putative 2-aminoethylphosphonate ABC transporter permease subunit [Hyphomicrobiaceae bacterium]|nr:putative 2-aminoethylphosphonate ABC transporter permease subunit [Hyphomicrobiaceae bacterium]